MSEYLHYNIDDSFGSALGYEYYDYVDIQFLLSMTELYDWEVTAKETFLKVIKLN